MFGQRPCRANVWLVRLRFINGHRLTFRVARPWPRPRPQRCTACQPARIRHLSIRRAFFLATCWPITKTIIRRHYGSALVSISRDGSLERKTLHLPRSRENVEISLGLQFLLSHFTTQVNIGQDGRGSSCAVLSQHLFCMSAINSARFAISQTRQAARCRINVCHVRHTTAT